MGGIGEQRIFWGPPHPHHPQGCPYQLRFGVPWPRRGGGSLQGDMEAGGCTERARPQPRWGRGGRVKGILPPRGPHSPPGRSAVRQSPKPSAIAQPPAMPAPPAFPLPPEIPVPPRRHRGRIRLRMGGDNRRMWGPGSDGGRDGHKLLGRAMAVGAPGRGGTGSTQRQRGWGRHQLTNLIN